MINNLESILQLAAAMGIDISKFDGNTLSEAISFIAENYKGGGGGGGGGSITASDDGDGTITLDVR